MKAGQLTRKRAQSKQRFNKLGLIRVTDHFFNVAFQLPMDKFSCNKSAEELFVDTFVQCYSQLPKFYVHKDPQLISCYLHDNHYRPLMICQVPVSGDYDFEAIKDRMVRLALDLIFVDLSPESASVSEKEEVKTKPKVIHSIHFPRRKQLREVDVVPPLKPVKFITTTIKEPKEPISEATTQHQTSHVQSVIRSESGQLIARQAINFESSERPVVRRPKMIEDLQFSDEVSNSDAELSQVQEEQSVLGSIESVSIITSASKMHPQMELRSQLNIFFRDYATDISGSNPGELRAMLNSLRDFDLTLLTSEEMQRALKTPLVDPAFGKLAEFLTDALTVKPIMTILRSQIDSDSFTFVLVQIRRFLSIKSEINKVRDEKGTVIVAGLDKELFEERIKLLFVLWPKSSNLDDIVWEVYKLYVMLVNEWRNKTDFLNSNDPIVKSIVGTVRKMARMEEAEKTNWGNVTVLSVD